MSCHLFFFIDQLDQISAFNCVRPGLNIEMHTKTKAGICKVLYNNQNQRISPPLLLNFCISFDNSYQDSSLRRDERGARRDESNMQQRYYFYENPCSRSNQESLLCIITITSRQIFIIMVATVHGPTLTRMLSYCSKCGLAGCHTIAEVDSQAVIL